MNITIAMVFVRGTATTRIESECLVQCSDQKSGADIDTHRQILEQAFIEIHGTQDVEILFPELGECIDDSN